MGAETARRAEYPSADSLARALSGSEYGFLLDRLVDSATLTRAYDIARRCGVHPHQVLIANGWLRGDDYYRALARAWALPFKGAVAAAKVAPSPPGASLRACLASGLLKERHRTGRLVLAPERMPPNALRNVLARLPPSTLALATPQTVRRAILGHFASHFTHDAIDGLGARFPIRAHGRDLLAGSSPRSA